MQPTFDELAALLLGTLPDSEATRVRSAIDADRTSADRLGRLHAVLSTLRADAADPVPERATIAAIALAERLPRSPARTDRLRDLVAAAHSALARLVFDSRLEGSLAGIRGGTGFAVGFATDDGVEVDLECGMVDSDRFRILAHVSEPEGTPRHAVLEVRADLGGEPATLQTATIDADGMVRLELEPGTYRLRLVGGEAGPSPIDLPAIAVP